MVHESVIWWDFIRLHYSLKILILAIQFPFASINVFWNATKSWLKDKRSITQVDEVRFTSTPILISVASFRSTMWHSDDMQSVFLNEISFTSTNLGKRGTEAETLSTFFTIDIDSLSEVSVTVPQSYQGQDTITGYIRG